MSTKPNFKVHICFIENNVYNAPKNRRGLKTRMIWQSAKRKLRKSSDVECHVYMRTIFVYLFGRRRAGHLKRLPWNWVIHGANSFQYQQKFALRSVVTDLGNFWKWRQLILQTKMYICLNISDNRTTLHQEDQFRRQIFPQGHMYSRHLLIGT